MIQSSVDKNKKSPLRSQTTMTEHNKERGDNNNKFIIKKGGKTPQVNYRSSGQGKPGIFSMFVPGQEDKGEKGLKSQSQSLVE